MGDSISAQTKKRVPYVRLGKSGLKVSKIILGCMSYGDPKWQKWVVPEEEAIQHIKAAYDAGIQTFDTANTYSNGESEIILGKAIKQLNLPRDEIVVMTKMCFVVGRKPEDAFLGGGKYTVMGDPDERGYINQYGLSRKHIFESVKASLKRLQLDYIDVFQCHRFDSETPIEETMQALDDVVKAGYVRYIGMSSCFAYEFHAMQNYAIANKLTPFISMQNHYNLLYREEEREMFPTLKMFGVGAIPWSPLGRGLLTRPFSDQSTLRGETDVFTKGYLGSQGTPETVSRVEQIAKKKGIPMSHVALGWILSKDHITAPIVGMTSLKNLEDLIAGVNTKLTEEEVDYLEESYKPTAVFGHI